MKLNYPAEAFALGIILFSAGMKEAFAAGILVILSVVFAELLKNLLKDRVPEWSLKLCVSIAAGSVCASANLLGFAALGTELSAGTWVLCFLTGLLCARWALSDSIDADYGELLFECAAAWGIWILLAALREFMTDGSIFNYTLLKISIQSVAFRESYFAFLTAGLTLALTNVLLKKSCVGQNSLWVVIPAAVLVRPFTMDSFGKAIGIAWAILVPVVLFLSVKQTLKFSRTGKAFRGLPADLMAAGLIYMILSIY